MMQENLIELITNKDEWVLSEGENDGYPFILRFRPHLGPFIDSKIYNIRLIVIGPYQSESENLMLMSDKQSFFFKKLEDAIILEVEHDLKAILAFVYTGNNQREWHFYTNDLEEMEVRLNKILGEMDYPELIDLQFDNDPDWEEYCAVIAGAIDDEENVS